MKTLSIQTVDEESLKSLLILLGKCHVYCKRQCGKWGSPTCFSCMLRDVRQLHQKLSEKGKEGDYHG